MVQQPEALNIAISALQCARHGQCDHAMADEAIAALRAQVERLQAERGQVVATLHDDGYWTPAKSEAGRALNDRLMQAGTRVEVCLPSPPAVAQAGGADERDLEGEVLQDFALSKFSSVYDSRLAMVEEITRLRAALAAQPARVAMTDEQIAETTDAHAPFVWTKRDERLDLRAYTRDIITKFCELNGITPGDGRAHG